MDRRETAQTLLFSFHDLEKTVYRNLYRSLPVKLTPSQFFVLLRLMHPRGKCGSGKASAGLRVSELASGLGVTVSGMTQLITGLEKDGYLRREMDPEDRRAVRVLINDAGKKLMEPGSKFLRELFGGLAEFLGDADTKQLIGLLERANVYFTEEGLV